MFRAAAFVLLVAILVGCSKKNDATPPGGGGEEPSDPNATYELKFPPLKAGDRHEVMKSRNATATITTKNSSQTKKDEFRYEFTETVVEVAADDPLPAKATRVYTTADRTDPKGEVKGASYVGKNVTIEKYMKGYKFSANGGSLPPAEQLEMGKDFRQGRWKLEKVFPRAAVKVGDEWAVDFAAITGIGGNPQTAYDKEKSRITGKLVRAYRKDGRQWGVIDLKIALVLTGAVKGTVDGEATFDVVTDGSAQAGTFKVKTKATIQARDIIGNDVTTTVEGTEEHSLTPAK
jgi:hypothetical protein